MKRLHIVGIALLVSLYSMVLFFAATGLIQGGGKWYSHSMIYRNQTDAILSGRVYLADDLTLITYDHALVGGKIQQAWGLGVPFLRLPFEISAHIFGFKAFPDRLALGFYLWLASFLVFLSARASAEKYGLKYTAQMITATIFSIIVSLLPAVVALGRTRFVVYEEAVLYGYIISVIMLAVTPLVGKKKRWIILLFVFFCGLSGFFRPTVLAYGAVSASLLLVISKTPRQKMEIAAVFFIGCALLGASNYSRFGSLTEFGHGVNVDADPINTYQLKFNYPFVHVPIFSAAKELGSAIFFNPPLNNSSSLYSKSSFGGDSGAFRWRNFYSKTFSVQDFAFLLVAFGIFFWLVFRRRFNQLQNHDFLSWSILSFVLMFCFYLYTPSMSSRYVVDFGASILGMVFAIFFFLLSLKIAWKKYLAFTFLGLYFVLTIHADYANKIKTNVSSKAIDSKQLAVYLSPKLKEYLVIVSSYGLNEDFNKYGIFTNGTGWETGTGAFQSSILIFADNMDYLKLVFSATSSPNSDFLKALEIRIGSSHVRPSRITLSGDKIEVFFSLPNRYKNTSYVLPIFIKMLPESRIADTESKTPLVRIEWRSEK